MSAPVSLVFFVELSARRAFALRVHCTASEIEAISPSSHPTCLTLITTHNLQPTTYGHLVSFQPFTTGYI